MRRLCAALGIAVLAALAAGCGSSGGSSGGSSSDGSSGTKATGSTSATSSAPVMSAVSSGAAGVPGYTNPALPAAMAINGVTYKAEPNHNHKQGPITYDASPPVGGDHSQYWADCSGSVYPKAIANENAVHALEHGAVWITYQAGLPADQVAILAKSVDGVDRMLMSPYPNLSSKVSLQSWDYQLFVDSATDPRIAAFIQALRFNPKTSPEPNATCSQPSFKLRPSEFGQPLWVPAG